jgi:CBS domain-containing protein
LVSPSDEGLGDRRTAGDGVDDGAGTLARIDSFPYRHRLSDIMTRPVTLLSPSATLAEAAARMDRDRISSVVVEGAPGMAAGIVTERDVLRLVARAGAGALDRPLAAVMSSPVETLPPDVFVYRAIARMDRLGIRHLVVAEADGTVVGMITARGLLRQRAGRALALGDQIVTAPDAEALGAARAALPALARGLLAEDVPPATVAGLLSEVLRDMIRRSADLALAGLALAGAGPPPAPWCLLALGSAGRGETLLGPDQDHAIVHAGTPDDTHWFRTFGRAIADRLHAAGVPLCKGGVMASEAAWCHDAEGWDAVVGAWVRAARPQDLLSVDVFFDFRPVAGDPALADALRARALEQARGSIGFLKNLAAELDGYAPPLGWFGGFRLQNGRLDLKATALFPIVAAARVLALRHGIAATGTAARLDALAAGGHLPPADGRRLRAAHRLALGLVLNQQLVDAGEGRVPSSRVDVRALDPRLARQLRAALRGLAPVATMVRDGLAEG